MSKKIVVCLAILCLFLSTATTVRGQDGGIGRHKRIFVVPRTKPVTIDGDLSDWDLSGQLWVYVMRETADMQGAKFAMMYDADALYLSGEVRDLSPMMNRHDPKVDPDSSWDADACQFRMVLDSSQGYPVQEGLGQKPNNDQMVHMTLWYYTDRKEPCLSLRYGMNYVLPVQGWASGVVPADQFQAAYKKMADGHGYTFEYRIPWKTLNAKRPLKAGDLVASTVQFNWSRPDGLHTAGGASWAYDVMGRAGFTFQESGCWGKAVFSDGGNLPHELVEEGVQPEPTLPLTFEYDMPEDSEATIAIYNQQGAMVRTLLAQAARRAGKNIERWDGLDDVGRPLAPATYTWKGLYHQPITTKFLLSVHNSGNPPYKLDDNTGGWGGDEGYPQAACPVGDEMLLSWNTAEAGWSLIRVSMDGQKHWGSTHGADYLATDGQRIFTAGGHTFTESPRIQVVALADFRPLNFGYGQPFAEVPPGGTEETDVITGLSYSNGIIYTSFAKRNLIALVDAQQGTIKGTWNLANPGRSAARGDGSLIVVSGEQVVVGQQGQFATLIADHLDHPTGVAIDAAGEIFVANRGNLQNISVFDPRGKYERSIGKAGGRPWRGRYDPSGMLEPLGITVDKLGRVWVPEELDYPKRVSVWDGRDGKLIKEYFGGSQYSTWVSMDPRGSTDDEVFCHDVQWKIDLDKGTWSPQTTLWRAIKPNEISEISEASSAGHLRVITAKNGKRYAWGQGRDYGARLMIQDGDVFKPILATMQVVKGNPYIPWPPYPAMSDYARFRDGLYVWQDANNDQTVQPEEVSRIPEGLNYLNWLDEDLNIWCYDEHHGVIFRPVRIEADGRPVYDFSKGEQTPFGAGNGNLTGVWTNVGDPGDRSVFTILSDGDTNAPNISDRPHMTRWSRDGKELWTYQGLVPWHDAMNMGTERPGKIWGATSTLGIAGDFTGVGTYFGPFHILTRDGLYVAMLFHDGRASTHMGPENIAAEGFTGQLARTKSGRYLLLGGDQDGRITEVLGLNTVKPLPGGTLVISNEDSTKAGGALTEFQRLKAKSKPLTIVRGKASLPSAAPVAKASGRQGFQVKLAYDSQNLYVQYDVDSETDLVNAVADPRIIFKGGNLIDIQLATDPAAPTGRKQAAPGDIRILLTRQGGKPVAVLFRPKVAGFSGQQTVLESPTGKEPFDRIETVPNVDMSYEKTPGGFKVVATIPLAAIGLKLQPGTAIKIDAGYIFGNSTGTQAIRRVYWSNNSFSSNVVNDVPNESRLEPGEWGAAMIE